MRKLLLPFCLVAITFMGCSSPEEQENPAEVFTPTVFSEQDFYWDKDTSKYKELLISQVNRIHANNPACREIDPGTLTKSTSKGTDKDPVFFVTCGSDNSIHNVFFSKSEAESGEISAAPKAMNESDAIEHCTESIKQNTSIPSSVNTHNILGKAYMAHANGNALVTLDFDAKNALGDVVEFQAKCIVQPSGNTDISISKK